MIRMRIEQGYSRIEIDVDEVNDLLGELMPHIEAGEIQVTLKEGEHEKDADE